MDILFLSICERLKQAVPELNWIDMDAGQLDDRAENYPFLFPAAFIDFPAATASSLKGGSQDLRLDVVVRLALDIPYDTHQGAPDQRQAAESLKLLNSIQSALHGYTGSMLLLPDGTFEDTHFQQLERNGWESERRDDGIKVFAISFSTMLRDNNAVTRRVPVQPVELNLAVTVEE
jgi:hypothetical protein